MNRLAALVEAGNSRLIVRAPLVGRWSDAPREGALLSAGAALGILRQGNRRYRLVLPEDACGVVHHAAGAPGGAVGYGACLFELSPLDAAVPLGGVADAEKASGERGIPVPAPTDGVFYRGSAPDAPPFVAPGDEIAEGQPLGLVEVMKTFNQVLYGGDGFPPRARVVRICCEDGADIRAGEPIAFVESAAGDSATGSSSRTSNPASPRS